ncbi:RNA-binding protein [Sneathiella marina]|uniref:RNA-binding protein n=1 Tax=Sneathiella marina TaxID=2950108 RepID=A0ABY4W9W7_9PROT|nr:RNA-binding protein [Sneathiella marina]USG62933.1 RNA-binding protein [Sneathiella marina]
MKLIVLNLPRSLSEADMANLFKTFGEITAFNLVMDDETGSSKGFGFVEMKNGEEAEKAIEDLHGKKIEGRRIRVKTAH